MRHEFQELPRIDSDIMRFVTIRVCEWIDIHLSFFAPIREIRGQLSF